MNDGTSDIDAREGKMGVALKPLPCPHCGKRPTLHEARPSYTDPAEYCWLCDDGLCGTQVACLTEAQATTAWNQRHHPEPIADVVERVAKAIFEAENDGTNWRWAEQTVPATEHYVKLARAAIAAIRGQEAQP